MKIRIIIVFQIMIVVIIININFFYTKSQKKCFNLVANMDDVFVFSKYVRQLKFRLKFITSGSTTVYSSDVRSIEGQVVLVALSISSIF